MSRLANRVISVYNRKTSIRFARAEWEAIDYICKNEGIPRKTLFELIDLNRDEKIGLTSAIRLFTIIYYKNAYTSDLSAKNKENNFTSRILEAIKGII